MTTLDSVTDIGTDRQLFVDDYWVDQSRDVERRLHSPERREVAIASDRPWDTGACCAGFMQDGDLFRAWYRCDHDPSMFLRRSGHDTAYAESADGIHWEKPDLGLFEIDGSTANNIVWMGPGANMVPFHDPNPDVPDDERYKTIVRGNAVVRALVRVGDIKAERKFQYGKRNWSTGPIRERPRRHTGLNGKPGSHYGRLEAGTPLPHCSSGLPGFRRPVVRSITYW